MFYAKEELSALNRKELQKLCKQFGIKANKRNIELVDDLFEYFNDLQKEDKNLQENIKETHVKETFPNITDTQVAETCPDMGQRQAEENCPNIIETQVEEKKSHNEYFNSTMEHEPEFNSNQEDWVSEDDENNPPNQQLREELMEEVKRRAQEKITKIPLSIVNNGFTPQHFVSPGAALKDQHLKEFKKMDSIDIYLEKKRKRAEKHLGYQKKLKVEDGQALHRMKTPHETPSSDNVQTTHKCNPTTQSNRFNRKSSLLLKKAKSDASVKEITFNFVSKLKSPVPIATRTSPRLNALKERNSDKPPVFTDFKKTPGMPRKSVQFTNLKSPTALSRKPVTGKLNKSLSEFRSPGFTGTAPTSAKKTPIKFDLLQSLKKPLTYKPHTGKLKDIYFSDLKCTGATQRVDADKSMNNALNKSSFSTTVVQKVSVKEIAKKVSTRENRRAETYERRSKKRGDALSKRRGILTCM